MQLSVAHIEACSPLNPRWGLVCIRCPINIFEISNQSSSMWMQNSCDVLQMKIQPSRDIFISKGIFERNVVAVAPASIHWRIERSSCPIRGYREWEMGQTVFMSRKTTLQGGNFIFLSFSRNLSAAQPPPPSQHFFGLNTLGQIVFPSLLKPSSLTCSPVLLLVVFQMTPWSSTRPGTT